MRRAVRFGAGWYGFNRDRPRTKEMLGAPRRGLREGRQEARPTDFEIIITPPMSMAVDAMQAYAEVGVDRLLVNLGGQRPEQVDKRLLELGRYVKAAR